MQATAPHHMWTIGAISPPHKVSHEVQSGGGSTYSGHFRVNKSFSPARTHQPTHRHDEKVQQDAVLAKARAPPHLHGRRGAEQIVAQGCDVVHNPTLEVQDDVILQKQAGRSRRSGPRPALSPTTVTQTHGPTPPVGWA